MWQGPLLVAGAAGCFGGCRRDRGRDLVLRLVNQVDPGQGPNEIGLAFLQSEESATLENLLTAVHRDLGDVQADVLDPQLAQWLAARIAQDFEEDRIVRVEGWVLSVTEARLSALSVLLGDSR